MKKVALIMISLFALILSWCGGKTDKAPWEKVIQAVKEPVKVSMVKIGVIAPLSWPWSSYGQDVVEVVDRFGKVFNETHDGIELKWIVENGGCNGKDATSAVQKLIEVDNVLVIVWGVCSSETLAASIIAQEAWVLMIAPWSASSALAQAGDRLVRTNSNTVAAETLWQAVKKKYKHIGVVIEQKDYPKDMAKNFISEVTNASVNRFEFQSDDHDFAVLAKQIAKHDDIGALFVFTQSEATSIPLVKSLKDEWLLDLYAGHIYGANTLLVPWFLEMLWEDTEGMQEVNVVSPIVTYDEDEYIVTLKDYAAKGDGFTVLQAADAMAMIIEWVERNAVTREDIKRFVYGFDRRFPYEWYLGEYRFDERGEAIGVDFGMYEVKDGKRVLQPEED